MSMETTHINMAIDINATLIFGANSEIYDPIVDTSQTIFVVGSVCKMSHSYSDCEFVILKD